MRMTQMDHFLQSPSLGQRVAPIHEWPRRCVLGNSGLQAEGRGYYPPALLLIGLPPYFGNWMVTFWIASAISPVVPRPSFPGRAKRLDHLGGGLLNLLGHLGGHLSLSPSF